MPPTPDNVRKYENSSSITMHKRRAYTCGLLIEFCENAQGLRGAIHCL